MQFNTLTNDESAAEAAPHMGGMLRRVPRSNKYRKSRSRSRKGSLMLLAASVFFTLTVLAGFAINIAYMEMVRTEQRVATDAAAKAALVALGQSQSREAAIEAALYVGNMHKIAGRNLALKAEDVVIGSSTPMQNGSYRFTPYDSNSVDVTNAVRVECNLSRVVEGGVPLVLTPSLLGNGKLNYKQQAAATRIEMDVCLVVDRSGSMAWSLSNIPFEYPAELKGLSPIQNYFKLPHSTESRWAVLKDAVDVFVTVLNDAPIKSRVALASYSSNFTFGVWTSVVASIDSPLTLEYLTLPSILDQIGTEPLIGNTNIAAGLREGINALTNPSDSRMTSCKTIVLLTDGLLTQGDDPVQLATMARNMNIRIHTIAFSAQADADLMTRVAQAGGGQCYIAPDAESLRNVFRTIAATLPNMLTE